MFAKKYLFLLHIKTKEFWSMVHAEVKCLIWTVMEILWTCVLQKVGLNWWRGLEIYVLTYFQDTEKKNKLFLGTFSSAETSNFCNNELVKTFIKRDIRISLHAVLKKRLVTSCYFVKYIKALNCHRFLVMIMGCLC